VKELRWVVNSLRRGCCYQREHESFIQENPLVAAGDSNVCIGPTWRYFVYVPIFVKFSPPFHALVRCYHGYFEGHKRWTSPLLRQAAKLCLCLRLVFAALLSLKGIV